MGNGLDDTAFRPLGTVSISILQIILTVSTIEVSRKKRGQFKYHVNNFQIIFSVLAIALVAAWPLDRHACEPFYFITYAEILFWTLMMVSYK